MCAGEHSACACARAYGAAWAYSACARVGADVRLRSRARAHLDGFHERDVRHHVVGGQFVEPVAVAARQGGISGVKVGCRPISLNN